MDTLARVVHNLVVDGQTIDTAVLSPAEQEAIEQTRHLLRLTPQDLVAVLAHPSPAESWLLALPALTGIGA